MPSVPLRDRLKLWLARRSIVGWSALFGALLTAPSLTSGLVADDWLQRVALRHQSVTEGWILRPFDLFRFAIGDARIGHLLMDAGEFPWAANPALRLAFWRPITSATHVLDYALWPNSPFLMHAQSLAWFALAIALAAVIYRRVIGATWVAGLAAVLFAIDDAHGPAVGWISNRNAVVALALALPVLWLHDRWRRDAWKPGAWLAPLALAVALLAGESSLAILAYIVSYALWLDTRSGRARAASIAPYLAVVVLWRIAYAAQGYGASGSAIYVDPARDPAAFLALFPSRLTFLLLGQFAGPWADFAPLYSFLPWRVEPAVLALGVGVIAVLAVAIAPLLKRDPRARFFATGLVLAAVPVCSTFPADRLLLFVGIGAFGLIALLFEAPVTRVQRFVVWAAVVVHVALAPPLLALRSRSMVSVDAPIELADRTIPRSPDVTSKTAILVNPPNDVFGAYVGAMRTARGVPKPERLRVLASGTSAVAITREDTRTLLVAPEHGFLEHEAERMLRSPREPMRTGDVIDLAGVAITITSATPDGRPLEARFAFDRTLEDPSLIWLAWGEDGYVPWPLPHVGERVVLPGHNFFLAVKHSMEIAQPTPE